MAGIDNSSPAQFQASCGRHRHSPDGLFLTKTTVNAISCHIISRITSKTPNFQEQNCLRNENVAFMLRYKIHHVGQLLLQFEFQERQNRKK